MLGSKLHSTLTAGLALVVLLFAFAVPGGAMGQDPAADQYLPGSDTGTPPPKDEDKDPVPNETGGSNTGLGGDSGGSGSGGDDSATSSSSDTVTPIVPTDTGTGYDSTGTGTVTPTTEPAQNKAQRDLENIARGAAEQREAVNSTSPDANPATELLRSDSGGGDGMGIFLWVLIAGTLVWAVGSGVIRHRQDGHTV